VRAGYSVGHNWKIPLSRKISQSVVKAAVPSMEFIPGRAYEEHWLEGYIRGNKLIHHAPAFKDRE
jgi:hypothetical protein